MNRKIAARIRNPQCTLCRLHRDADAVCVTARGPRRAEIMVVGRMPNSENYQVQLEKDLREAGLDPGKICFTSAVKCRNFELDATRSNVKACTPYLDAEIAMVKPKWILSLGNEALQATTGHSGVMTYRGKSIKRGGATVIPTISPLAVNRNPGQRQSYIADLNFFASQVAGKGSRIKAPKIWFVKDLDDLKKLKKVLRASSVISFDVETWSPDHVGEHHPDGRIICLAGTVQVGEKFAVWALPLAHPQSPFRKSWRKVLGYLAEALEGVPKQIAHNGKYDCRWLAQHGVRMHLTYDTMLAVHLLNENLLKGLKFQVQNRFGVKPWAMDTKDLRQEPIDEVLEYCALDTYYTWHLYRDTKQELTKQPRIARVLKLILMPASDILVDVERRGVWMDREKLASNYKIALDMRAKIDEELMAFVPPTESEGWIKTAKGKPSAVNFNPSNFLRWWLFEYLEFPVIERGKAREDGSPGMPSVREVVMLELRRNHPHPVVELLLERSKWQKYCSAFLSAYEELLDEQDRIHTTFKLYGTVTGRLSSGKEDREKVTSRAPVRGVNLQQVPRDDFIRGLFGAAPGFTFVEADFSQIELRIAAFLSKDRVMNMIYQQGRDIHAEVACSILANTTPQSLAKLSLVRYGLSPDWTGAEVLWALSSKAKERKEPSELLQLARKKWAHQTTGRWQWGESARFFESYVEGRSKLSASTSMVEDEVRVLRKYLVSGSTSRQRGSNGQRELEYSDALQVLSSLDSPIDDRGTSWKELRKKGKAVSFGFIYGMGWRKFIRTAFEKYEVVFTEAEAQGVRKAFFEMYPDLLSWHARQRRLVQHNRRVQSPVGRVRHLPDIDSRDQFVRAEAERQAINSPVQSFGSDMTMLAMIQIHEAFKTQQIEGYFISTVHDALLFEIAHADVKRALPLIKDLMENLPLKRKFGVTVDLPIIVDIMVGKYWGDARQLSPEEVHDYQL
jgi:uracil-DNA glycosylase family 4